MKRVLVLKGRGHVRVFLCIKTRPTTSKHVPRGTWCQRTDPAISRAAAFTATAATARQQAALLGGRFLPLTDLSCLTQNISTGLAAAGVIVIARSIRVITKFRAAAEIPVRFIERNVRLRGKVHSLTERGIEVEHVPIYLPVISPLLSKRRGNVGLLQIYLHCSRSLAGQFRCTAVSRGLSHSDGLCVYGAAGGASGGSGADTGGKNVAAEEPGSSSNCLATADQPEDNTLHCLVSQSRGSVWSYCMNEELLRLGLARRAPIAGVPPGSPLYWRLHKRLHRAEVKAEKKGVGLWKRESLWERASKALRDNPLLRLMGRIFKRTRAE